MDLYLKITSLVFRFGFKRSRDSATILIVNLAFADLMYCSINLPLYTIQYWNGRWPFDRTACRIFAVFRYVNAFGEWMSLAVIALSRCIGLIRNQRCFSWKQGFTIIVAIWFYAFIMILPAVTEVCSVAKNMVPLISFRSEQGN